MKARQRERERAYAIHIVYWRPVEQFNACKQAHTHCKIISNTPGIRWKLPSMITTTTTTTQEIVMWSVWVWACWTNQKICHAEKWALSIQQIFNFYLIFSLFSVLCMCVKCKRHFSMWSINSMNCCHRNSNKFFSIQFQHWTWAHGSAFCKLAIYGIYVQNDG